MFQKIFDLGKNLTNFGGFFFYLITYSNGHTTRDVIAMPGNNTNPDNLAELFAAWPEVLNHYDLVMTKSCYPSHIKDTAQLSVIKEEYQAIFKACTDPDPPPLLSSPPRSAAGAAGQQPYLLYFGHRKRPFCFSWTTKTVGRFS